LPTAIVLDPSHQKFACKIKPAHCKEQSIHNGWAIARARPSGYLGGSNDQAEMHGSEVLSH
jgi:hypothetical protein